MNEERGPIKPTEMPAMDETTAMPAELGEAITLESALMECRLAKGYLVFAAFISDEKDKDENPIIKFRYLRNHFPIDDSKNASEAFKNFIKGDILRASEDI